VKGGAPRTPIRHGGSPEGDVGKRRRKRWSSSSRSAGRVFGSGRRSGTSDHPKKGRGTTMVGLDPQGGRPGPRVRTSEGSGRKVRAGAAGQEDSRSEPGRPQGRSGRNGRTGPWQAASARRQAGGAGERAPDKGAAIETDATPELVSKDRGRRRSPRLPAEANTGRTKTRRSGGWQRCRPPFRVCGAPGYNRPRTGEEAA